MDLQSIIDFIMGNLFFLFIVISGIFSFFKRANQTQENTEQKRRPVPPPIRETKPFESPEMEPEARPTITTLEKEYYDNQHETLETVNPYYEQLKQRQIDKRKVVSTETKKNKQNIKRDLITENQIELPINKKAINKQKVIEGVVWAEILGQPRARKKHSPIYYKKS